MMSERPQVLLDDDLDDVETVPVPEPNIPAVAAPAPGSLLGRLREQHEEIVGEATTVLPVGRHDLIAARYRALTQDEQVSLAKREQRASVKARKLGVDERVDQGLEHAAIMLSTACVELLWRDEDGTTSPLVEALARDGVNTDGDAPLRYDRRTARVLDIGLPADAGAVDLVRALHEFSGSYLPLTTASADYTKWLMGESNEALKELLDEGN